jgi:anaphase-promoting complex subunit 1
MQIQPQSKVLTLKAPFNSATLHERKVYLYISHSSLTSPLECELSVTRKRLSPSASASQPRSVRAAPRYACVPRFVDTRLLDGTLDLVKLRDGHVERIARLTSHDPSEPCLALAAGWGNHLPLKLSLGQMKLSDQYNITQHEQNRTTAGLHRIIAVVKPLKHVVSPGPSGRLEIIDGSYRRHGMELRMSPSDSFVAELFRVLSTVLPNYTGDFLLEIWWSIRKSLPTETCERSVHDWQAFVATIFTLAVPFVDDKSRKASNRAKTNQRRSSGRPQSQAKPDEEIDDENSSWRLMCDRQSSQPQAKSWSSPQWAWALHTDSASTTMSPTSRRSSCRHRPTISQKMHVKNDMIVTCIEIARQYTQSPIGKATDDHWRRLSSSVRSVNLTHCAKILLTLNLATLSQCWLSLAIGCDGMRGVGDKEDFSASMAGPPVTGPMKNLCSIRSRNCILNRGTRLHRSCNGLRQWLDLSTTLHSPHLLCSFESLKLLHTRPSILTKS